MSEIALYTQQIINGLVNGGAYALIAVGLTLVFGILNIVNFAHGEGLMLGGYATLLFSVVLGINFWISLVLAMILVAILFMVMEKLVFKPIRFSDPMNSIIASMGASIMLLSLSEIFFSSQPKAIPPPISSVLSLGPIVIPTHRLIVLIIALILIFGLTYWIKHSKTGNAMRAVSQDITAAKLMGVNINRVASVTFALSGALTAAAGGLLGPLYLLTPHMGSALLLKSFAVVILGGIGNVRGAIYAAFILGVTESLAAQFINTGYKDLIAFVVLIIVLIYRPSGLFGVKAH